MNILQSILDTLNSISPEAWNLIIDTFVGAIIVSPLAVGIKKWLNIEDPKRREKIMTIVVIVGSLGVATIMYLQNVPTFAPWFVAVQGMLVYATSQPVYYFGIKPLFARLGTWIAGEIAKATAINEAKGAAIPETGLPIGGLTPEFDDFSQ